MNKRGAGNPDGPTFSSRRSGESFGTFAIAAASSSVLVIEIYVVTKPRGLLS